MNGFFMPAEWAPHERVWLAWPSAAHLWLENLKPAQDEFVRFCQLVDEPMKVLVPTVQDGAEAESRLKGLSVSIELMPFGDIWLRDTSCLFFTNARGEKAYARTAFNGWGGKYVLPHDAELAKEIGKASGLDGFETPWILEGGSVELDGEGTCLTSRQCLLNQNRNPGKSEAEIEEFLKSWLGCEKVLWLNDGLLNDHTDGHIDTMARYVAPGVVACMQAQDAEDPNYHVMEEIARDLASMTDAKGRKIKVVRVPSPGAILNEDGDVMPASYLNFYIANKAVVVPTYGSPHDEAAVQAIAAIFPGRKTTGASARAILSGGGAFHCMSQNEILGHGPNEPVGSKA
jgi:agmatine deiminase